MKLSTGNYSAGGTFYNEGSEDRPVRQSIQLGDGGTGLIIDMQGIWNLKGAAFLYYDWFYLVNPRNTKGSDTNRSRPNESIMSVLDQQINLLIGRVSFIRFKKIYGFGISLVRRIEGVPVRDLVGESDGSEDQGMKFRWSTESAT